MNSSNVLPRFGAGGGSSRHQLKPLSSVTRPFACCLRSPEGQLTVGARCFPAGLSLSSLADHLSTFVSMAIAVKGSKPLCEPLSCWHNDTASSKHYTNNRLFIPIAMLPLCVSMVASVRSFCPRKSNTAPTLPTREVMACRYSLRL